MQWVVHLCWAYFLVLCWKRWWHSFVTYSFSSLHLFCFCGCDWVLMSLGAPTGLIAVSCLQSDEYITVQYWCSVASTVDINRSVYNQMSASPILMQYWSQFSAYNQIRQCWFVRFFICSINQSTSRWVHHHSILRQHLLTEIIQKFML